jgi:CheY-like chemotaxis protein
LIAPTEILVVDDEVGIRELLHEILEDEGFVVRLPKTLALRGSCVANTILRWCCSTSGCLTPTA